MSSETKKLIKEYCIYVNRDTVRLSDENDFHLTADIDTFWRISDENDSFAGLVSSYISLDLNKLFSEVPFADLVIHLRQHEIYEVQLFVLSHKEYLDRIFLSENNSKKPIVSKEWILDVTALEKKRGRLAGIRKKAIMLFQKLHKHGAETISHESFLQKYNTIYGEKLRKDDLLKALALRRIEVDQIYDPSDQKEAFDIRKIFRQKKSYTKKQRHVSAGVHDE